MSDIGEHIDEFRGAESLTRRVKRLQSGLDKILEQFDSGRIYNNEKTSIEIFMERYKELNHKEYQLLNKKFQVYCWKEEDLIQNDDNEEELPVKSITKKFFGG